MARWMLCGVASLAWIVASQAWAADESLANWPQWRGPQANGFTPSGDPPTVWNEETNTNIKWKAEIPGRGSSTPIIWDDKVFILTAIKTDRVGESGEPAAEIEANDWNISKPTNYYQFVVLCFDRNTGNLLWRRVAAELVPHEGHHETGSFAAGSPVTDGQCLYVSFGSFGIFCYDLDGKLLWQTDLGDMQTRHSFGEGSSPALAGDRLVINWDHEAGSKVYVLDAHNGDVVWQQDRDEGCTWTSPLVTEYDGGKQVILNGRNRARSYDLATGKLLWECGGQTENPIPSPMRFEDLAICMSGFRGAAAFAIPLDSAGDLTDTDKVIWTRDKGTPYISSPTLVDDRLFFTKERSAIVSCLDAKSGEPIINQKRLPAIDDVYASPVAAAGRVYFTGRNGATVVIDATKDSVEVLAENKLDDTIDASPAIVDKSLFIRGEKKLYCITEQ